MAISLAQRAEPNFLGDQINICLLRAVTGANLSELHGVVHASFSAVDEAERTERSALARLEVNVVRRFSRLGGMR